MDGLAWPPFWQLHRSDRVAGTLIVGGGESPTHCPEELFLIAVFSFLWYNQELFCVSYCYWPGIRDRSPHGFIVRYPETQESGVGKRGDTIVQCANWGFQMKHRISTSHPGVIPFFQPNPLQSWCFRRQDKLGIHISSSNLDHSWRPGVKWKLRPTEHQHVHIRVGQVATTDVWCILV